MTSMTSMSRSLKLHPKPRPSPRTAPVPTRLLQLSPAVKALLSFCRLPLLFLALLPEPAERGVLPRKRGKEFFQKEIGSSGSEGDDPG